MYPSKRLKLSSRARQATGRTASRYSTNVPPQIDCTVGQLVNQNNLHNLPPTPRPLPPPPSPPPANYDNAALDDGYEDTVTTALSYVTAMLEMRFDMHSDHRTVVRYCSVRDVICMHSDPRTVVRYCSVRDVICIHSDHRTVVR